MRDITSILLRTRARIIQGQANFDQYTANLACIENADDEAELEQLQVQSLQSEQLSAEVRAEAEELRESLIQLQSQQNALAEGQK